ncbi:MAG: hypothetical protein R3181_12910 [Rubricoccaceae bacterium]|nr:hypothetical protein [Rubricoccaceae bacterium]
MGRIIHAGETPAKRRHAHLRSCAEALRLLAQDPALGAGRFSDEAKDLTAFLVFNLRGIGETIEASAQAWDDRNYWKKAEKLRDDWRWAPAAADELGALALDGRWAEVPPALIALVPRFQSVTVAQQTRNADWWVGAYRALRKEAARTT